MATTDMVSRFRHAGLLAFDPKAGLLVLEAVLGVKKAELVAASFLWEQQSNKPMFRMALFASLVDHNSEDLHIPKPTLEVLILLSLAHMYSIRMPII